MTDIGKRLLFEGDFRYIESDTWDVMLKNKKMSSFIEHSDGVTWDAIQRVPMRHGEMYVSYRFTEITNPKWYMRPVYWLLKHLP